jgi:AbiV family abortive infection protein
MALPRGPISPTQAAELRAACRANAGRLVDDAAHLLDAQRLPSAFNHAYFALEELVKARALLLLELMLIDGDTVDWADFWKKWTDHSVKSVSSLAMRLDDSMVKTRVLTILTSPAAAALPTRAKDLRDKRESALYVDWKRGQVTSPVDAIDEPSARDLVERARSRCGVHDELERLVKDDPTNARELLLFKITLYVSHDTTQTST